MAPRKGESADDKCRRHAQNQAKPVYQGVKIRVQDTIKRKPEILPALEKWMVDNGHMGVGMGADVPYKAEPPKTPVKSHVKHEESDGAGDDGDGLARSVGAEFDLSVSGHGSASGCRGAVSEGLHLPSAHVENELMEYVADVGLELYTQTCNRTCAS